MRAILFAAVILTGCVSVGRDFDIKSAESLEPGLTEAQVVERLGEPTVRSVLPDGRQRLTWAHTEAGLFGTGGKVKSVTVLLGTDGRVMRPAAITTAHH